MCVEIAALGETFATHLALVRFGASVESHVCLETAPLSEALAALLAHVRPFSRVDALVLLEVAHLRETLVTVLTLVSLKPGSVANFRCQACKNGRVYVRVSSFMSGQLLLRGEAFCAIVVSALEGHFFVMYRLV